MHTKIRQFISRKMANKYYLICPTYPMGWDGNPMGQTICPIPLPTPGNASGEKRAFLYLHNSTHVLIIKISLIFTRKKFMAFNDLTYFTNFTIVFIQLTV